MFKEKLINDLKQFGLNEYESRTYVALTINGPLTASQISEKSRVPQSKVYEVMRNLISKNLAETWTSKPQKFKAIEPVLALKKIMIEKKHKLENLQDKTMSIINDLKPFNHSNGSGLWSGKGKRAFLEKAMEILGRAKKRGYATTSRFTRYDPLDNALTSALRKGVKIKMLGTSVLDEAKRARAEWYSKQGINIKILPMSVHPYIGVGDEKEICIRVDNGEESDFIWSDNPSLVNIVKSYFEELWRDGRFFKPK
jgi:sugar-specific transcriptional regulator TrmB